MKPSYRQIPLASAECKDDTGKPEQQIHPLSLILLILWAVFTVGLLCLLEVAVAHGPGSAEEANNFHPPWALITLPTILLTVFTQAHVPITAFHLARIAVSALQNPNTTPNSWAELFWMADQEWTGPVGIIKTTLISIRSRTRASCIYILFATTSTVALVIPVLLSQAYQVQQVLITASREIHPNTVLFGSITGLEAPVGLASWETGFSVTDMYNTSLFTPMDQPRNTTVRPQDFFFASDIGNANVTLPGFRLHGDCRPLNVPNPIFSGDNLTVQMDIYQEYCSQLGHDASNITFGANFTAGDDAKLTLFMCDSLEGTESLSVLEMGIFLYQYYSTPSAISPVKTHGLIQCNSTLSAGTASLSGVDHTYTHFTQQNVTIPYPLYDFAESLFTLPTNFGTNPMMIDNDALVFRALGFEPHPPYSDTLPNPPSPLTISEGLWSAISHNVGSLANFSKKPNRIFNASVPVNITIYTRNTPYAVAAHVMLILWLTLLAVATVGSYRRTFSPSLNSYVAAGLIHRERFLLEDVPIGAAGDNDRLKTPFKPMGLCSEMELEQELKRCRTT
ncbi:hypothetical protein V5O48_009840 [Marasmius crinis-equi]|uniref:Uncharacterized protein n=1 Tax=Marasmius crinis-equi TaxID=585013 RepID=A0ABR3FA23_9AGAR